MAKYVYFEQPNLIATLQGQRYRQAEVIGENSEAYILKYFEYPTFKTVSIDKEKVYESVTRKQTDKGKEV